MQTSLIARARLRLVERWPLLIRALAAATLLGIAWFLGPRALSTLTVLTIGLGVSLIVFGGWAVLRGTTSWRVIGTGSVLAGMCALAWWSALVGALPALLAGAVALAAGAAAVNALASRCPASALRAGIGAATACGFLVIAVRWEDIGAVLTAWCVVAVLVWAAVVLVLPAPRDRSRGLLSSVAVVLLAGAVAAVGIAAAALGDDQPRPDEFYDWEQEMPDKPGVLLRVDDFAGATPDGARSMRMLYTTTDLDGRPRVASAVVAVPLASSNEPRTVLAWQHGTTGVARECAPSVTGDALTEVGIPGISQAISRGWVVVATDYPGQGTTGPYPYLVGGGEGRATLDAVRALRQLDGANASDRVMLWGHSQGGHATLWAAQLADTYAPQLDIVGVAALSAASDPYALATRLLAKDPNPATSLIISYVLIPFSEAYADVAMRDYVDPAGGAFARAAASRCATSPTTLLTVLASLAVVHDRPLYTLDLEHSAAGRRLQENIADASFRAPLLLGQGVEDEVIPIDMQRSLAGEICATERAVSVHEYPGKSHMGVIAPGAPLIDDLYEWADRVIAGDRPRSC